MNKQPLMQQATVTRLVLDAGKSPDLAAALNTVRDSTAPDGRPRFSARHLDRLEQAIVCGTYRRAIYELCHLVSAADAAGQGQDRYERLLFAVSPATGPAFEAAFARQLGERVWRRLGVAADGDGICLSFGAKRFCVRYGRMPYLAALFEFIVTVDGYAETDGLFATMLADPADAELIGRTANALSQRVYRYLSGQLDSAHIQNRFRQIVAYLGNRAADDGDAVLTVDDSTILDFWYDEAVAAAPDSDFRTYRIVFEAFVHLIQSVEAGAARFAMAAPLPIGTDSEQGEFDLARHVDDGALPTVRQSPLSVLNDGPAAAIKFLTGREQRLLELLSAIGPLALRLPLSLLRSETFGAYQARITQALRNRRPRHELVRMIDKPGDETYAERRQRLIDLKAQVGRLIRATYYILLTSANEDGDPADERSAAVLNECRQAFRAVARVGFEEAEIDDPERLAGFRAGAEILVQVEQEIGTYLDCIDALEASEHADLESRFHNDQPVFQDGFAAIYGVMT